jgi:hypothetical protein
MRLFAVFKHGIYRHECGGIFSKQALAESQALHLARVDRDRYHEYQVVPFELDATPADNLGEVPPIRSFRKPDSN